MEAHPIPQNVTAFQFRLVGDMTLKQFLYLATGVVIAYVSFVFLSPNLPLIAWPLTVISSLIGVSFAFIPISDRPLDYWLGSFLKAVYSPTKRVWQKDRLTFSQNPLFARRLALFLQEPMPLPQGAPPVSPTTATPTPPLTASLSAKPVTPPPAAPAKTPLPSKDDLSKTVELARQAQILQEEIAKTQQELDILKQSRPAQNSLPEYTIKTTQVLQNLQKLVEEGSEIKKELAEVTHQTATPTAAQPTVTVVIPTKTKPTQLTLTSFPNVINGVIKDAAGNYLEGVVVVIYDKSGLPVRALKTNRLGQFSGSTPLPNGTYRIEMEKESLAFDVLQIELSGLVLAPLQVSAKKLIPH